MKKLLVYGCILFCCNTIIAQIDSFQLDQFKYHNISIHQFELKPDFSSAGIGTNINEEGVYNPNAIALQIHGSANYNYLIIKEKYIGEHVLSLNYFDEVVNRENSNTPAYYLYGRDFDILFGSPLLLPSTKVQVSKDKIIEMQNQLATENKHYWFENHFVELNYFNNWNKRRDIDEIMLYDSTDQLQVRINAVYQRSSSSNKIELGIGRGRINDVNGAEKALFILSELKDNGLLTKELTTAEITEFSKLLIDIENARVFDTREKRIFEMTLIDSFLNSKQIISNRKLEYYSTTNDVWNYGLIGQKRLSGALIKIGYQQGITLFDLNSEEKYFGDSLLIESIENQGSSLVEFSVNKAVYIKFQREKPLNLYWQSSFFANVIMGETNSDDDHDKSLLIQFRKRFDYIINTRSRLNIYGDINYHRTISTPKDSIQKVNPFLEQTKSDVDRQLVVANIGGGGSYFINPKLEMNLNYNFQWLNLKDNPTESTKQDRYLFEQLFKVSFRYYIL